MLCLYLTHSVEEAPVATEEEEEEGGGLVAEDQETSVKKKKKKGKKKHIKEEPLSEEEPCTSTAIPVCLFLILCWRRPGFYFIELSELETSRQWRWFLLMAQ